jgi:proline iminopeptidase
VRVASRPIAPSSTRALSRGPVRSAWLRTLDTHASLTANTTWDLVADIERIRERLGIERWLVFGGSWGSTLALAYAETHPERVAALVVRGIFLCRDEEIRWFYQEGASWIYPDYWEQFLAPIPVEERGDLLSAYHKRLTGEDEATRLAAAQAWSVWEGRTATLRANPDIEAHFAHPHVALSLARIECHYFMNRSFFRPNQLLEDAHRLQDIPGIIIQGATTPSARCTRPGISIRPGRAPSCR